MQFSPYSVVEGAQRGGEEEAMVTVGLPLALKARRLKQGSFHC